MPKISFASIQVTEKCNLDCGFCFRKLNLPETDSKTIKKIISELKKIGVETIIITGGEPLLRKDIKDILSFIKKLNMQSVIQTNGLLLKKHINSLAPYLDWISLSLDGDSQEMAARMRGPAEYFDNIVDLLGIIKRNYQINVKLGTVITKINYKHIENIGKIVKGKVITWKLYQFYPRANCTSENNKSKYYIEDNIFEETCRKIIEKYPKIHISTHSINDYNKSPCLLIDPDGKTFISKVCEDYYIGNILKNSKEIIVNCYKFNILNEIEKNFNKTYRIN